MALSILNAEGVLLVIFYRPPMSNKNKLTNEMFLDEFSDFVARLATISGRFILMGDFNVHMDLPDDAFVR